jgi:YaiO family outer membrane protein
MKNHLFKFCLVVFLFSLFSQPIFAQSKASSSAALMKQIKTELEVRKDYRKALELSKKAVSQYPNDADFRYVLARSFYLNNDLKNAQMVLDDIIKHAPNYKDVYQLGANIQMAKKNGNEALKYVNMGLNRYPRDRDLRIKKMDIFQSYNNYAQATLHADTLLIQHRNDTVATRAFINYHNGAGYYYKKIGNITNALREFERVLEIDPKNQEAIRGSMTTQLQMGDGQNSLSIINRVLADQPNNYEYLMKKVGVLQDLKRYAEALDVLQQIIRKYPNDSKARQLEIDLKLEAARYFKSTDPYFQYQSVLEKSPNNTEALQNVINIAISRGLYDDALHWINKALGSGSDKELLIKKISVLQHLQKYGTAAATAAQLYYTSPNPDSRETYIDLHLTVARAFAVEQLFDSAMATYLKVLAVDPTNEIAINSSINILITQKQFSDALKLIDQALSHNPNDRSLLLKKAAVFQENEQFSQAVAILEDLYSENSSDPKIRTALVENLMLMVGRSMQIGDYGAATSMLEQVLFLEPFHKDALHSAINIELAKADSGALNALELTGTALVKYENDKDFLLKKSEALFQLGRFDEATTIVADLHARYPYNQKIREGYRDQLLAAAASSFRANDTIKAIELYKSALAQSPFDTNAIVSIVNTYIGMQEFDSALVYAERGAIKYPNSPTFHIKRAAVLELQGRHQEAAMVADTILKLLPESKRYTDYAAYLKSKSFKNQMGIAYLNSSIDSAQSANIATLQYTHFFKKINLTTRLNFAGRSFGTGLQGELESYINHSTKWYSFANIAVANSYVFPKYKAAYSLFHSFKGWEAELGGRWLNFDSLNAISAVGSLAKYFGDFWINCRGYLMFINSNQYVAATLTARQYINNKTDFFFANVGYGNSPDEFSRTFQLGTNISFRTYSIGAGYQKMFNYRNIVSVNATWYNQRIDEKRYRNQYDIYLTFFRRF